MESEFDLENPLPISNDLVTESRMSSLFSFEADHVPSNEYCQECLKDSSFQFMMREKTISLILHFSQGFEPFDRFSSYLAINYLDRFLSCQPFLEEKPWILRLVAVSCVSLALKMRKTESISITGMQNDGGFLFDCLTIEKMELLILGALKWRLRSITPFSFINFFITLFKLKDLPSTQALKARATEIILKAQNEIKLLEFKPSIISAAAALSASHELFPLQFPCFKKAILSCSYVNKDIFSSCYNMMEDMAMEDYESVLDMVCSSYTPANVLDLQYYSSSSSSENDGNGQTQSQITNTTEAKAITTASAATLRLEKDLKRRKISGFRTPKAKFTS